MHLRRESVSFLLQQAKLCCLLCWFFLIVVNFCCAASTNTQHFFCLFWTENFHNSSSPECRSPASELLRPASIFPLLSCVHQPLLRLLLLSGLRAEKKRYTTTNAYILLVFTKPSLVQLYLSVQNSYKRNLCKKNRVKVYWKDERGRKSRKRKPC